MISRGNRSEKYYLAPLDRVIGGSVIDLHLKLKQDPHQAFVFRPDDIFSALIARWGPADFALLMKAEVKLK